MEYLDKEEFDEALVKAREKNLSNEELHELLDRVSRRDYPPEEVEADIAEAIAEVRGR